MAELEVSQKSKQMQDLCILAEREFPRDASWEMDAATAPSPQQHLCISRGSLLGPASGITYCSSLLTHSHQQEFLLHGEMLTQHIGDRREMMTL